MRRTEIKERQDVTLALFSYSLYSSIDDTISDLTSPIPEFDVHSMCSKMTPFSFPLSFLDQYSLSLSISLIV